MKYDLKRYSYNCSCGYSVRVHCDCGLPVETISCRKCGNGIKRVAI